MRHVPVLLEEVLKSFDDLKIDTFVDATLGAGGHSSAILQHHDEIKTYVGIDQDKVALKLAAENINLDSSKKHLINDNFGNLKDILNDLQIKEVDAFLFDVGVSSMQLDEDERGFSFRKDATLDMRMDQSKELTAEKVVNSFSERELDKIFYEYGEEKASKKIARKIVENRSINKIITTKQLAELILEVVPRKRRIHPATLVFQALRIFINDELNVLEKALQIAIDFLSPTGRIAVISFHSLEDRIVKEAFKKAAKKMHVNEYKYDKKIPKIKILTKKPILPSLEETKSNTRARSAKLRVAERCRLKYE